MSFRRAQYVIWTAFISISINATAETDAYIWVKYYLFRQETEQDRTFIGRGSVHGLPRQTLEVVEAAARSFIESSSSWDAGKMTAHISLYEVLNLRLFVTTKADVR